jgi:hypothetical protein
MSYATSFVGLLTHTSRMVSHPTLAREVAPSSQISTAKPGGDERTIFNLDHRDEFAIGSPFPAYTS